MNILIKFIDNINPLEPYNWVLHESCGAVNLFIGTTRNDVNENGKIIGLSYEINEEMALEILTKICNDALQKFNGEKVAIFHVKNKVNYKEPCIVLAFSSPHRNDAFEACKFIMNMIKKDVPVWKREHYENNDSKWQD